VNGLTGEMVDHILDGYEEISELSLPNCETDVRELWEAGNIYIFEFIHTREYPTLDYISKLIVIFSSVTLSL